MLHIILYTIYRNEHPVIANDVKINISRQHHLTRYLTIENLKFG